jgi:hypothetical protein
MARDLKEAADALREHGLDLAKVIRDTHTETMIRIGSLLNDCLEIALKAKMLKDGEPINERAFWKSGKWATLASKICRAKEVNLISQMAISDATRLREIRNKFSHARESLHFDNSKIVELAHGLSTYETAETNQAAIFAAMSKVTDELKAVVRPA